MENSIFDRLKKTNILQKLLNGTDVSEGAIKSGPLQPLGRFLYINDDLILECVSKEVMSRLNEEKIPNEYAGVTNKLIKDFSVINKVTDHFNDLVKLLKREIIKPVGFHIPLDSQVTSEVNRILSLPGVKPEEVTNNIRQIIVVSTLTKDDIIKSSKEGKQLDWTNYLKPDGKTYPYTLLAEHTLTEHGFPIGLFTMRGQDVDPNSIKHVFYIHPDDIKKEMKPGIYFEVFKPSGTQGPGGTCGIIVSAEHTVVIMNETRKEAYFINVKRTKKKACLNLPLPPKVEEEKSFSADG